MSESAASGDEIPKKASKPKTPVKTPAKTPAKTPVKNPVKAKPSPNSNNPPSNLPELRETQKIFSFLDKDGKELNKGVTLNEALLLEWHNRCQPKGVSLADKDEVVRIMNRLGAPKVCQWGAYEKRIWRLQGNYKEMLKEVERQEKAAGTAAKAKGKGKKSADKQEEVEESAEKESAEKESSEEEEVEVKKSKKSVASTAAKGAESKGKGKKESSDVSKEAKGVAKKKLKSVDDTPMPDADDGDEK